MAGQDGEKAGFYSRAVKLTGEGRREVSGGAQGWSRVEPKEKRHAAGEMAAWRFGRALKSSGARL
jgi:hypothetical protein